MTEEHNPKSDKPRPAPETRTEMSRREFARRAVLTSAPAIVAPAMAAWTPVQPASTSPQAPASTAPPAPSTSATAAIPQSSNLPKLSPEAQAEVDARLQSILGQYATRFSDDQKSDLRRLCTLAQPPLERLRAYHLENADGPALYLKPLVERERKSAAPTAAKSSTGKP